MHIHKHLGWVFFLFLFMAEGVSAQAFPFRAIKKGDPLPSVTVEDLSGKTIVLESPKKGVAVLLFWGADSSVKKRYSIKALRDIPVKLKDINHVRFMAINAQGDASETIKAVAEAADYEGPLYRDTGKKAYKALGVFVMPSVLIAKAGKVEAGFGYTHDFADLIKGDVQILLGLKTRQAVKVALHPKTAGKSAQEKEALRYYNLGRSMMKKGMVSQAEEAFKKALASQGTLLKAILGLTEIYLKRGNIPQAQTYLSKAESLAPNALKTILAGAKILVIQKKVDEALAKVLPLALTRPRSKEINAVLGQIYEQKGDFRKALKYYKKALKLCQQGR